jgi:DNA helicase HerA-like ATPase
MGSVSREKNVDNKIGENVELANKLAIALGYDIVGKIARHVPSKVEEEDLSFRVVIPVDKYYEHPELGRIGIYLGIVDIKSLSVILSRVTGYDRRDFSSILYNENDIPPPVVENEVYGTLITNVIAKCEALTKVEFNKIHEDEWDIEPADIVVEPQSPVFLPTSNVLEKLLSVKMGNLIIGELEIPSSSKPLVSINPDDLNFHMLVIGTTGSGKTSFIKNLLFNNLRKISEEFQVFILDATGDYYNVFLPPLHNKVESELKVTIAFPISKYEEFSNTSEIYENYFSNMERIIQRYRDMGINIRADLKGNEIYVEGELWKGHAKLYPFYLNFNRVKNMLHNLNPYLSEQGARFLKFLVSKSTAVTLEEFVEWLEGKGEKLIKEFKIHKETFSNIFRAVSTLNETGLFDLNIEGLLGLDSIISNSKNYLIFDLYNPEIDSFSQKVLVHYILDKIFERKDKEFRGSEGRELKRTIIAIDEAHRFFPSNSIDEDISFIRKVAGKLSMMMRLGRRRKMGFIFSTHDPRDLNEIVVELANTKVIFRSDEKISRELGVPEQDSKLLRFSKSGVGVMLSPLLRQGMVWIKTPIPPLVGHYDESKDIKKS